jgi:hypothetical protein
LSSSALRPTAPSSRPTSTPVTCSPQPHSSSRELAWSLPCCRWSSASTAAGAWKCHACLHAKDTFNKLSQAKCRRKYKSPQLVVLRDRIYTGCIWFRAIWSIMENWFSIHCTCLAFDRSNCSSSKWHIHRSPAFVEKMTVGKPSTLISVASQHDNNVWIKEMCNAIAKVVCLARVQVTVHTQHLRTWKAISVKLAIA